MRFCCGPFADLWELQSNNRSLTSWCGRPLILIQSSITQLFSNWSKKAASIFDRQQSEGAMPLKFAQGVRVVAQPD